MRRLLLPLVLLILGLAGGVGAGLFLAAGSAAPDASADQAADDGDGEGDAPEGEEDGAGEDPAEGGESAAPAAPPQVEQTGVGTEYVRLNNQFVVPIVRNGAVRSLVVLGLTLEVDTGQNSTVFNREPRLRDSFLRVLFAHANAGGFDGTFTEAVAMEPLREALREAAAADLGGTIVHDVLITDIVRQDG